MLQLHYIRCRQNIEMLQHGLKYIGLLVSSSRSVDGVNNQMQGWVALDGTVWRRCTLVTALLYTMTLVMI